MAVSCHTVATTPPPITESPPPGTALALGAQSAGDGNMSLTHFSEVFHDYVLTAQLKNRKMLRGLLFRVCFSFRTPRMLSKHTQEHRASHPLLLMLYFNRGPFPAVFLSLKNLKELDFSPEGILSPTLQAAAWPSGSHIFLHIWDVRRLCHVPSPPTYHRSWMSHS